MNGYVEFLLIMIQHVLKAAQCCVWAAKPTLPPPPAAAITIALSRMFVVMFLLS